MEPASLLAVINATLSLAEVLIPRLAELVKSGAVTPDEQNQVLARYQSLKAAAEKNFVGPEWDVVP